MLYVSDDPECNVLRGGRTLAASAAG